MLMPLAVLLESCKANRPERSAGAKGIKREAFRANPRDSSASPQLFEREKWGCEWSYIEIADFSARMGGR
jgi:hypothetical protein